MAESSASKVWNRKFVHLILIEWCLQFGIYTTTPIASNFAVALGAGIGIAGFVAGLNSTFALCMRPFTGWISDRFAKKSLLIVSSTVFAIAGFGCALSSSVEMMGVFRATQGIAFALKSVIVVSFASFVVPKENVGSAVGWVSIASTIASALAPTVGSAAGEAFGYSASFAIAGCFFLGGLVLAITFKVPEAAQKVEQEREAKRAAMTPEERKFKFNVREFFFLPAFIPSILGGTTSFCFSIIATFLIMVAGERGIEGASIYFLMYSVSAFFSKPAAGTQLDKRGFTAVFMPSLIIMVIAPAILMFADNVVMVALAGLIFGVGHASAYSSAQAFAIKLATPETTGRAANTFYIVPDIGMGIGPLLGGLVYQAFGATPMFAFCIAIGLCDFVLACILKAAKKI